MFLEIRDISVDLGQFHLDNVNLSLDRYSYLVIIGPTGSGKSVLLETIAGFYSPDYGKIFLDGEEITSLNPENRGISIVYQDYVLFPHMNVFDNMAYGLKKKTRNKDNIKFKVLEMAELLNIDHLLERSPETLSGGEMQRTSIARSLLVEPNILLMDEPFSALDVETHSYITTLIKNVIAEYETTVIHVTHNFDDVWNLAEQVAVMKDGKILQHGRTEDIFSRPSHNFVAEFVGVQNVFDAHIVGSKEGITTLELKDGLLIKSADISISEVDRVLVAVRPENIVISNQAFVSSLRNQIKGVVEDIIRNGPTIWVDVRVKDTLFKGMITSSSYDLLQIEKGKEVYISFKALNVKIIDMKSYNSI